MESTSLLTGFWKEGIPISTAHFDIPGKTREKKQFSFQGALVSEFPRKGGASLPVGFEFMEIEWWMQSTLFFWQPTMSPRHIQTWRRQLCISCGEPVNNKVLFGKGNAFWNTIMLKRNIKSNRIYVLLIGTDFPELPPLPLQISRWFKQT